MLCPSPLPQSRDVTLARQHLAQGRPVIVLHSADDAPSRSGGDDDGKGPTNLNRQATRGQRSLPALVKVELSRCGELIDKLAPPVTMHASACSGGRRDVSAVIAGVFEREGWTCKSRLSFIAMA